MAAITTNAGAGFIIGKKLRHNCFSRFCMLLNKGFGEWDGPVTEELNWMEQHQANYIYIYIYTAFIHSFYVYIRTCGIYCRFSKFDIWVLSIKSKGETVTLLAPQSPHREEVEVDEWVIKARGNVGFFYENYQLSNTQIWYFPNPNRVVSVPRQYCEKYCIR